MTPTLSPTFFPAFFPALALAPLRQENSMPHPATASLDVDEQRVARAQRLLIQLGASLVSQPFDTRTHDQLRDFLAHDAPDVLASLAALRQRPEADLRRRADELAGHSLYAGGAA
ncbi:hypothetical protein ACF1FX_33730 [Streptomyces sp. NPDC014646]|uniref:hypothetical protein n=1 Tax=Streptomyces sp. NPDC014646 TaxID=3364877 RepID=UPI0036F4FEBC